MTQPKPTAEQAKTLAKVGPDVFEEVLPEEGSAEATHTGAGAQQASTRSEGAIPTMDHSHD
ncbi:TPA: hypothetical protein DCQ44_00700 [Candidatus Taylorbacteria bacterium]|nr:hypothetical protein [Candidatus Taylorbacteria bacterium]